MKKLRLILLSLCVLSLTCFCFSVSAINANASVVNKSAFTYTGTQTSAVVGTEGYSSLTSPSNVSFSGIDKKGVIWEYEKGESITYNGTLDLSDNTINSARTFADSIFEGYGLYASTMANNKSTWGDSVYETTLTFKFYEETNPENYFEIVLADNDANFGYVGAKAPNQNRYALRWGGNTMNTKGLVPADRLNVSSAQTMTGWGLNYKVGLNGYNTNEINLSYNNAEKAAFTRAYWGGVDTLCYIRDFDMEYKNESIWSGFVDASKIKLTITCDNGYGALLIKSVDGVSLAYDTASEYTKTPAFKGVETFVTKNGAPAVIPTAKYDGKKSSSDYEYSNNNQQGVVWEYESGEEIVFNKTINLADNRVNLEKETGDLAIEYFGLWSTTEAILRFRFAEKNNPNKYFEIVVSDYNSNFGYVAGFADSFPSQAALRWGGSGINTKGLVPADGLNVSSEQSLQGWGLHYKMGLNAYNGNRGRFYFDNDKKALFTDAYWGGNERRLCYVYDFSKDYQVYSYLNPAWSFDDATEIVVSVKCTTGSGAVMFTNVDGETLSHESNNINSLGINDSNNSNIYVEENSNVCIAGVEYEIPKLKVNEFTNAKLLSAVNKYENLQVEVLNNATVVYNKKYVDGDKFTAVSSGTYTVNYYTDASKTNKLYTYSGAVKGELLTNNDIKNVFTSNNGSIEVTDGGLILTGGTGATFNYNGSLYLGDATIENLKNLLVMRALVSTNAPTAASDELISVHVTLTDANNPNNSILIWIHSNAGANTIIKVKTSAESDYAGYNAKSNQMSYGTWGVFNHSMSGTSNNDLSLLYDAKENVLHAGPNSYSNTIVRKFQPVEGIDHKGYFDNKIKSWGGFSTNEVLLSIKFVELDAGYTSTKLLVKELNGQSFVKINGELYNSASSIVIEKPSYDHVINKNYSFPKAKVLNVVKGESEFTGSIDVVRNNELIKTVNYVDGISESFAYSGDYYVTYYNGVDGSYTYNLFCNPQLKINFNSNVKVTINGNEIDNGHVEDVNKLLKFSIDTPTGYGISSVTISGRDITNYVKNNAFKLTKADAVDLSNLIIDVKKILNVTYLGKTGSQVISVFEGENALNSVLVEEKGYIQTGYFKDANLTIPFDFNASINEDTTIYVKYDSVNYNINYEQPKGEFSSVVIPSNMPTSFNVETGALNLPSLTATGYEFMGWYYNGVKVENVSVLPYGDVTLYPLFSKKQANVVTVTLNLNGGNGEKEINFISGGVLPLITPEKQGYVFVGWFVNEDLTTAFNKTTPITSNLTLYAKYQPETNSIVDANTQTIINNAKLKPAQFKIETLITIILAVVIVAGAVVSVLKIRSLSKK